MTLPRRVGRRAHREVREVDLARQRGQRQLTLLYAALQGVHHERGPLHLLDVEPRLRARDFEAQVEPGVLRNIDRAGEAGAVVDLPVEAGVEDGRVLHRVRLSGLVLSQVDPLGVLSADAELYAEEATARGRRN